MINSFSFLMLNNFSDLLSKRNSPNPDSTTSAVHQCLFSPLHVTDIYSDNDRPVLFSEGFSAPFGIIPGPRAAVPAGLHTVAGEEREVCDRECLEFSSPP